MSPIMRMLPLAALWWSAALLPAQNVLFEEGFDLGIPAAWSQVQLGFGSDVWTPGRHPTTGDPDVYHEYFCTNGVLFRDNRLVTPSIDLRGLSAATLGFRDHQVLSTWRTRNAVEVSVAGGAFTTIATITRQTTGTATVSVDLAAWVGLADVRIAFHYQGDIANEWRVDDVRVTTPQPVHTIDGLAAGAVATFRVRGAVPGNFAVFALSTTGPGPLPSPFESILLSPPLLPLALETVDARGEAQATVPVPPGITGARLWSQCVEVRTGGSLQPSNLVERSIS